MKKMQSGSPLLKEEVDSEDIADVVSRWTGIPVSKNAAERARKSSLTSKMRLTRRVAGQEEAIRALSDAVRRSRRVCRIPKGPWFVYIHGHYRVARQNCPRALADYCSTMTMR